MNLLHGIALLCAAMVGLTCGIADAALETQTFEDPGTAAALAGWTGSGNSVNGNSYGYSNSNFTGGASPAGEAGGIFARGTVASYYADLTLGGVLTRSMPISASGEFDVTSISTAPNAFNGSFFFAHFNSSGPILNTFAGLGGAHVVDDTSTSVKFRASLVFSDGTELLGNDLFLTSFPNSDRLWSYTWDPTGGAFGKGRLELTINGPGGGTSAIDVTAAHDARDFALNAFGLASPITSFADSALTITAFIDNVSYTSLAIVPEPASLTLFSLGGVFLLTARRGFRSKSAKRIQGKN